MLHMIEYYVSRETLAVKKRATNYGIEIIDASRRNREEIVRILGKSTGEVGNLEGKV